MPDLRPQNAPNLGKTTIQGTVKHEWGTPRPSQACPREHTNEMAATLPDLSTAASSRLTPDDSRDSESIDSAFSFNVSVRYYKEKDDNTTASTAYQFDSDERVAQLMEEQEDWESGDDVINVEEEENEDEDETDNLFNRDLFGLGVMKRAQSNLELM